MSKTQDINVNEMGNYREIKKQLNMDIKDKLRLAICMSQSKSNSTIYFQCLGWDKLIFHVNCAMIIL